MNGETVAVITMAFAGGFIVAWVVGWIIFNLVGDRMNEYEWEKYGWYHGYGLKREKEKP